MMCALALSYTRKAPQSVVKAGNGITVRNTPPVELDSTWQKWLGEIQARQFSNSEFIIVVSSQLGRFAGQEGVIREATEKRAQLIHLCLLLWGIGYTGPMLKVCCNKRSSHLHIGPIQQQFALPRPEYRRVPAPTVDIIKDAVQLADKALRTHHKDYADRVRRGFRSIVLGWQSQHTDERLHNFIRAIEAIVKPGRGRITAIFRDRAQLFTGRSPENEKLLDELYNIRSCYEHTKDVLSPISQVNGMSKERMIAYRSLQAELLASAVYKRIFERPQLMARFSTQEGFDDFWAQTERERKAQWGNPINLHTEADKQFFNVDSQEY
jgi:hypothetical protein